MKRTRTLTLFVALLLTLLVLACGEGMPEPVRATPAAPVAVPAASPTVSPTATPPPPPPPAPPSPTATPTPEPLFPFSVTDSNGRAVTFDAPPERIVAYDSAVVEILFAIGEGHRVVGTHDFLTYPLEASDIPRLGDAFNMNLENIVAMKPDLVFVFFDRFLPDLERAGLKVLYLKTLDDDFLKIADTIRLWGRITGSPVAAEYEAVNFLTRVQRVREALAAQEAGPSVFQDEGDLWTPGADTLMSEVFELLKLQNIAYDISGYAQLSPEVIIERSPELIIASYGDAISTNPAFADLPAVRNKRILVPSSDALSIAGPRFVDGIEELARWAYPELFK